MFYFKNHIIPKYNIIAMNELTINYIQLFYILISFEFLIRFTLAYYVVSTSTDTKCSCSFLVFGSQYGRSVLCVHAVGRVCVCVCVWLSLV